MFFVCLGDLFLQSLVGVMVLKISANVINAFQEPGPSLRLDRAGCKLLDVLTELLAKSLRRQIVGGKTNDGELVRKQAGPRQIAQCREQFAFGQVAAGAENDHDTVLGYVRLQLGAGLGRLGHCYHRLSRVKAAAQRVRPSPRHGMAAILR